MTKKSYSEKLLDPRWQKKRLEVLNAAEFTCEICGDSESTLHVHHKQYFKGREVWDYEKNQLACLCKNCHANNHEQDDLLKDAVSRIPMDGPFDTEHVAYLIYGLLGIEKQNMLKHQKRMWYQGMEVATSAWRRDGTN
jgi:hypothetical protein